MCAALKIRLNGTNFIARLPPKRTDFLSRKPLGSQLILRELSHTRSAENRQETVPIIHKSPGQLNSFSLQIGDQNIYVRYPRLSCGREAAAAFTLIALALHKCIIAPLGGELKRSRSRVNGVKQ